MAGIVDDWAGAGTDELVAKAGGPVWDRVAFDELAATVRPDLRDATRQIAAIAERVLAAADDVRAKLPGRAPAA